MLTKPKMTMPSRLFLSTKSYTKQMASNKILRKKLFCANQVMTLSDMAACWTVFMGFIFLLNRRRTKSTGNFISLVKNNNT
jgi:hypothetical protein